MTAYGPGLARVELTHERTAEEIEERGVELMRELLELLGEDTDREGLRRTPERAFKALRFLTHGMHRSARDVIGAGVFQEQIAAQRG